MDPRLREDDKNLIPPLTPPLVRGENDITWKNQGVQRSLWRGFRGCPPASFFPRGGEKGQGLLRFHL